MTMSQAKTETFIHSRENHLSPIQRCIQAVLPDLDKILRNYALFNIAFISLGITEFVLLIVFFTLLTQSAVLAFSLAFVFLTFFSYFILRSYFQAQKPEQFFELKERYKMLCKEQIGYRENDPESFLALSNAYCKLSEALTHREYSFYQPPAWLESLSAQLEKFSCWSHWQDIQRMRELLLLSAVEENTKLVKSEPTSLESHASLANSYIMLSTLYSDPSINESSEFERWLPADAYSDQLKRKFRFSAERAIEEFKIIEDFAPDDPWVHAQLAYSYHDLNMPLEEIREYETLLTLHPEDEETMLKLGKLYFSQGMNAKGLRIYQLLKDKEAVKADEMIRSYGSYTIFKQDFHE